MSNTHKDKRFAVPVDLRQILLNAKVLLNNDDGEWEDAGLSRSARNGTMLFFDMVIDNKDPQVTAGAMRRVTVLQEYIVDPMIDGWLKENRWFIPDIEPIRFVRFANELSCYVIALYYAMLASGMQEGLDREEANLIAFAEVKEVVEGAGAEGAVDDIYRKTDESVNEMSSEDREVWMKKYATFQRMVAELNNGK